MGKNIFHGWYACTFLCASTEQVCVRNTSSASSLSSRLEWYARRVMAKSICFNLAWGMMPGSFFHKKRIKIFLFLLHRPWEECLNLPRRQHNSNTIATHFYLSFSKENIVWCLNMLNIMKIQYLRTSRHMYGKLRLAICHWYQCFDKMLYTHRLLLL